MNNPFLIMQAMQNPQQFVESMLNNPRIASDARARKAMKLMQNHDTRGLQSMATNICREYGTTPEAVRESLQKQFRF